MGFLILAMRIKTGFPDLVSQLTASETKKQRWFVASGQKREIAPLKEKLAGYHRFEPEVLKRLRHEKR